MKKAFNLLKKDISFLVLDYNRAENLYLCLSSIRNHAKFNYELSVLINGGDSSQPYEMFRHGLMDKIQISKDNEGSSLGALRLIQSCVTKYFIFIQSDNSIFREFSSHELKRMINLLNYSDNAAIDFSYNLPQSFFSERAFMMETDLYLSNDNHSGYGTGPFYNPKELNTEQTTELFIKSLNKKVFRWEPKLMFDTGMYAVLELPCGGILKRRCDTHQIWVIKQPKQKHDAFNLNDYEWDVILNGKWTQGSIPEHGMKNGFLFFSDKFDPIG